MKQLVSKASWAVCVLSLLLITGCASPAKPSASIPNADNPERVAAFQDRIRYVADAVGERSDYSRIPLDTDEEQGWFATIAFEYWDGQISRGEFINRGLKRFPDHRASFETVADLLKE